MSIFPTKKSDKKPQIIIVTKEFSGLGFAKLSAEAGFPTLLACAYEPNEDDKTKLAAEREAYDIAGQGIVEKIDLKEAMKTRAKYKEAYWIWDSNHNSKLADQLRKEGFKVFGGQELTDKMEHDRKFGTDLVHKAGMSTPPTFEFSTIEEGLALLDANPDKAYVFKPDEPGGPYVTYPPDAERDDKANQELYRYMQSLSDDGRTYILQERIKGTETNFEIWLYKGKPFFAFCDIECKRKHNRDEGELVGCAHDIVFSIPLNSRAIYKTVGKLIALPEFKDYTGFLDVNVIVADRDDYFLEFCARYGYNSHPNLFLTLMMDSFPQIMVDFMDGKVQDFYKRVRYGFGASITLRIDNPNQGFPIEIPPDLADKFYHFDTYKEGEEYFLAGYGQEIGIITAHEATVLNAGADVIRNGDKITFPMHQMRTDVDREDYPTSPQRRYVALDNMKYFDPYSPSDAKD